MTEINAVGDVVLKDPRAMRALADPLRLALLDSLQRRPATVDELVSVLDSQPQRILEDLEALAEVGLVERPGSGGGSEETTWAAIGKGLFLEIPEDAQGQDAARELSNTMFLQYVDLPRRWVDEDEHRLTLDWARVAYRLSARLLVTPDELGQIQAAVEGVLEPYLTRDARDAPEGASRVRILGYFMPEPPGPRRW